MGLKHIILKPLLQNLRSGVKRDLFSVDVKSMSRI